MTSRELSLQATQALGVVTLLRDTMRREGIPECSYSFAFVESAVRCLTTLQKELDEGLRLPIGPSAADRAYDERYPPIIAKEWKQPPPPRAHAWGEDYCTVCGVLRGGVMAKLVCGTVANLTLVERGQAEGASSRG